MLNQNDSPFTIKIFMVDGALDGLKIIGKSGWDGNALACSFGNYPEAKKKHSEYYNGSGVYILVGKNETDEDVIYIGIADNISNRLAPHHGAYQKGFWQHVIIFVRTTLNNPLNSAENSYLEHHLVKRAKKAHYYQVENRQDPQEPPMSEGDKATSKEFLKQILQVVSVIGISAFKEAPAEPTIQESDGQNINSHSINFIFGRHGCLATGFLTGGGFVVKKDSTACKDDDTLSPSRKEKRRHLCNIDILVDEGKYFRFTENHEFNSPSLAAAIVSGINENGRTMWKDSQGGTLGEHLERSEQES